LQTLMNSFGIKEEAGKTIEETLKDHLKDKELLLILDNCEHLIKECAVTAEMLLSSCPNLKIIATSRESLNCSGEKTYSVPSLTLPDVSVNNTPLQLSQYESVRLFIERALAVNMEFRVNNENAPALAEICSRLDGIPLAIELAAARIKVLSVEKICERLTDRFSLLTGGKRTALPRQQTFRAMVDWSYDLLSEKEKILWERLSVFTGGWTLESAEEICTDEKIKGMEILDLLNALTEKSIVIYGIDKGRYRILETLKQYGEEKLRDSGGKEDLLRKHLTYFMELSEKAQPKLKGSEMQVWLEKLEADHSNLQSATEWSIRDGNKEEGARLAGALGYFWNIRGDYSTGRRLLESILDNAQGVSRISLAKLLNSLGSIVMSLGEYERAQKFLEESLSLRREMGEKHGIAYSLNSLGHVAYYRGYYEQAQKLYEESLSLRREMEDKSGIANSLNNLGNVAYYLGNSEQAQKLFEESLSLRREMEDKSGIAFSLNGLGSVAYHQGNYEQAQKLYEECLALSREIGEKRGIVFSLNNLGNVASKQGNYEQAQKFFEESLTLSREIGDKHGIAYSLNSLGHVAYYRGYYEQAQKLYEESLSLRREMGNKSGIADSLNSLGNLAYNQENYEQAKKFCEESLTLRREMGNKSGIADSLNSLGNLAHNQGNYEQAQKFYEESLILRLETVYKDEISNNLLGFAGILCAANKLSMAVMLLGAVEAVLKSMGTILDRDGQKLQKQIVNMLHEKLSDEEFSKYFEEGKKLTLEQAAELALSNYKL